jgi:tocopherol cyclase
MLRNVLNPDLYHGKNKNKNFFEGWYFKLVSPDKKHVLAFIPGITLFNDSHCFIQVLNGDDGNFQYFRFHINKFKSDSLFFNIYIGDNNFSMENIILNLEDRSNCIKGHIKLSKSVKWPDSFLNPGSMGFYNYLTFMECYSQVCSMISVTTGSITINDCVIDFDGGTAYIEKNWGKAFPYSYIWTQCNNFKDAPISLSCSIGHIPFLFTSFTGFLIGLYEQENFYEFTTYNRSKIKLYSNEYSTVAQVSNRNHTLYLMTSSSKNTFMNIFAPRDNKMIPVARESLRGKTFIRLTDSHSQKIILESYGDNAGLEFSGDYKTLNTELHPIIE